MVLARLYLVPAELHILATDEESASALGAVAERRHFELFVGPADDVLARYCQCARRFSLDRIIRATGDNPLISHELASMLLARSVGQEADYMTFAGLPVGMGVELVLTEALFRAEAEARAPAEREHVCPYLYGHPELFIVEREPAPREFRFPQARVTVDTRADYEAMLKIYGALYSGSPISTASVISYLKKESLLSDDVPRSDRPGNGGGAR